MPPETAKVIASHSTFFWSDKAKFAWLKFLQNALVYVTFFSTLKEIHLRIGKKYFLKYYVFNYTILFFFYFLSEFCNCKNFFRRLIEFISRTRGDFELNFLPILTAFKSPYTVLLTLQHNLCRVISKLLFF